ncbi:uncharacterized protein si:dkey-22i16.9 [Mugil cephalus]|uniref:uncharacterized protein si:dkey-22i16.9 n=1 Tax=Mugil cephalus TaxID=48193 RepID=UPI001FB59C87|nr:uncharacterized protein si:dkey-22i16.9 [Mugil cephalus]
MHEAPGRHSGKTMARMLSVFTLVLLHRVLQASGKLVYVFLADSVDLSPNCAEERFLLVHSPAHNPSTSDTVATRINGVWTPGEKYRSRTEHSSTSSLILLGVNYNDQGWYESECGSSSFIPAVKLRVFVANVSVYENETLKLPCHSLTADRTFDSISWERNGKTVFKLDVSSSKISYGTGFEGKVFLSRDWFSEGDLSLMLKGVRLEDGGDYFCNVLHKGGREKEVVDAVRVNVNKRRDRDQVNCTLSPASKVPEEKAQKSWVIVYIIIAAVVSGTGCFVFGWWLKSRSSTRGPCDGKYSGVETSPEVSSSNHEETGI